MAKRNTKAGLPLRQLKKRHQQHIQQLKEAFSDQLMALEQDLDAMLYSQAFYHESMINLLTSENEPDSDSLIGAMMIKRWLRQSGQRLQHQLSTLQKTI